MEEVGMPSQRWTTAGLGGNIKHQMVVMGDGDRGIHPRCVCICTQWVPGLFQQWLQEGRCPQLLLPWAVLRERLQRAETCVRSRPLALPLLSPSPAHYLGINEPLGFGSFFQSSYFYLLAWLTQTLRHTTFP